MTNAQLSKGPTIVPATGTYRIDPDGTRINFRTRHLFGVGAVTGTVRLEGGEIIVHPTAMTASVTAVITASSFNTGNPRRDQQVMSSTLLDVERYPRLSFRADAAKTTGRHLAMTGELTVRNITRPVSLEVELVQTTRHTLCARARTRIDRYYFGVTALKGMAARYLDVDITITAPVPC